MEHVKSHAKICFNCSKCDRVFDIKDKLREHLEHHSQQKVKCEQCDETFTQINELNVHVQTYGKEELFECVKCNDLFKEKN